MHLYHHCLFFFTTLQLLLQSRTTHAQVPPYCSMNSSSTTFKNNLQSFFKSLTTGAPRNQETIGTCLDEVYGHAICYADSTLTTCTSCFISLAEQINNDCPDSKVASFWKQPGPCFIRYSDVNFFGVADTYSVIHVSTNNSSDHELFIDNRNKFFDNLIAKTNASANFYGTAEQNVTRNETLYGRAQCTRDLSHQECYKCLSTYIQILQEPSRFQYSLGVRIYGSSCYLHYERTPLLSLQQVIPFGPSPAPQSAPSPRTFSAKDDPASGTATKFSTKLMTIIIVAVVGGVVSLIVVICIWFSKRRFKLGRTKATSVLIEELQEVAASIVIYDFTTIKNATDNFSDKNLLGRGGFGSVFKGTLPTGQEIAVKRQAASSTHGATEFKTEVELLWRLSHNNLVKLSGCCIFEQERILCYEFLPNRSLDNILFGTEAMKCKELCWSRRSSIIKGICRGLHYLHVESPLKIVHRDLKASNILLDKDMNPKIADFGLARLFERDQTHTVTAHLAGTYGYIAPECSIRGTCSAKSDTYSFGILLLEIVSGKRNNSFPGSMYASGLINHVWKHWSEGKVLELKDPTLDEECIEEVTKCIHIALLCLQVNPSHRPNMETVANMLSGSSLPPLPPPKFIWGADISMYGDDESVAANLSKEFTVVAVGTANASLLSSFNRRA